MTLYIMILISKKGEDENSGPLEAKKNNIEKEIYEMEEQITQIQKEWIANQTELIEQQNTFANLSRDCDDLRTQKTILEQKKHSVTLSLSMRNYCIITHKGVERASDCWMSH